MRVALNGPGACTNAEATNILQAVYETLLEGMECIEAAGNLPISSGLWSKLATATIDIGCDTLQEAYGCTYLGGPFDTQHKILIHREHAREECMGSTVVHEILHNAGYSHPSDDGDNNEWHACAAYCTRCESCREGNEQNATKACAMCTQPVYARYKCGQKDRPGSGDCKKWPGHPYACVDLKEVLFTGPQECTQVVRVYCDGTRVDEGVQYCGDICPEGYTPQAPCDEEWFRGLENTCDDPPPFCRQ